MNCKLRMMTDNGKRTEKEHQRQPVKKKEIDLIEVDGNNLHAFEMKWKAKKVKTPAAFEKAYPEAAFTLINKNNYEEFINQTTFATLCYLRRR